MIWSVFLAKELRIFLAKAQRCEEKKIHAEARSTQRIQFYNFLPCELCAST
jgi:hypothetical protein